MTDETPRELVFAFEELPSLVGQRFCGEWFAVDAAHARQFDEAAYTTDNPYRFDEEFYPEGLVEGFHLLSLLDHLQNPVFRLSDGQLAGWNYGLDRVRFTSPVKIGDPVRLLGEVAEVTPRGGGFLVRLDCELELKNQDKPAMVASWLALFFGPATDDD